jgi:hypothetical protein
MDKYLNKAILQHTQEVLGRIAYVPLIRHGTHKKGGGKFRGHRHKKVDFISRITKIRAYTQTAR